MASKNSVYLKDGFAVCKKCGERVKSDKCKFCCKRKECKKVIKSWNNILNPNQNSNQHKY